MTDQPEFYDIFMSHSSKDKPAIRAICNALRDAGCHVFFDDRELVREEIVGSQIDAALDKTLVFAACWGPNEPGKYHVKEMDIGFNAVVQETMTMITVILPGAKTSTPTARFRSFPPIVFEHLTDTRPVQDILRSVDRMRAKKKLPPRKVEGQEVRSAPLRRRSVAPPRAVARGDGPYDRVIEQLRRDNRQFGVNFLVGPLTGIEPPTGEDHGVDFHPFPEAGEPSPWEVAQILSYQDEKFPTDADMRQLPLELVASWLAILHSDARLVQSRLQEILRSRGKSNGRFYDQFARVLRTLLDMPESLRGKKPPPPMIFTTNFGTNLEWHMMYHGVNFTRITLRLPDSLEIQSIRSEVHENTLILSDVYDPEAQPLMVPRNGEQAEETALDYLAHAQAHAVCSRPKGGDRHGRYEDDVTPATLSFDDLEGCILFKYHGSIDVYDSCVVNSEQLFELTRGDNLVPDAVTSRLKNAPSVVFGTSFLLTEVQQTVESVLRAPFSAKQTNKYLVPRERQGLKGRTRDGWLIELDDMMKESLKHHASKLDLIEVPPGQVEFLEALLDRMQAVAVNA